MEDWATSEWFAITLEVWHEYRGLVLFFAALSVLATIIHLSRYSRRHEASRLSKNSFSESSLVGADKKERAWLGQAHGNTPVTPANIREVTNVTKDEKGIGRRPLPPKRVTGSRVGKKIHAEAPEARRIQPVIFYFSLTESTKAYGKELKNNLLEQHHELKRLLAPQLYDLAIIDYQDFFELLPENGEDVDFFYILLIPSYNIDTALDNFLSLLQETHYDFRVGSAPLCKIAGYSVFGFGDREGWPTEQEGYCSQAVAIDRWMAKLSASKRAYPLGIGDVKSDAKKAFKDWTQGLTKILKDIVEHGGLGEGVVGSGDAIESEDEGSSASDQEKATRKLGRSKTGVRDLEDLGERDGVQKASTSETYESSLPIDFTTTGSSAKSLQPQPPKEMVPVSSQTYTALTKQGYTIIGSHSGVKICRWTKSALRGRGSCYKYSFYGIKSHLCMETTPSLSCSNKCVFCWRHGTNPVGTTWRWQVDPPDLIFNGAKEGHYKKIKMMRGVPGVRAERFHEAMRIRHCALSLVGEPIFYPHINEFVALLHKERISSFLVCNAQHPDQLAALKPVTQLYVSIDASNAESLRKIDRPLHRDYWQRFLRCLDILRQKRFSMRTVFRLTLVKGFNIESEVEGYAELVALGLPCFVEIKGVTYCGTSSSAGAGLTMQNVPFYDEIVTFVEALNAALKSRGLDYGIAAEHTHSCCVLVASQRFLVNGKWHTLIDYDKFFECLDRGGDFSPEDYMGPATPEWATWGHGGFDPRDERVDRKGRPKVIEKTR